jgi:hypothetical protein
MCAACSGPSTVAEVEGMAQHWIATRPGDLDVFVL